MTTEQPPTPSPKAKRSGIFSYRSKMTPTSKSPPAADPKIIEETVQTAVKEASAAALKVEEAMAEAVRAAEQMEAGTQRDATVAAVKKSATELRMSYHQYERLDEEVAEVVAPLKRPNCCESAAGSVSSCCSAIGTVCLATVKIVYSCFIAARTPALFYLFGCFVYAYLEGWSPLTVVYFLTVTSTTVGYGDVCPLTPLGKLFTCFYALVGITVVLGSLAPLVAFLRGDWRDKLLTLLGCGSSVNTDDPNMTMEQINKLIDYKRRYALAMLGPGVVLATGLLVHFFFIREPPEELEPLPYIDALGVEVTFDWEGWIDSFYWSVITATTIGYGDIAPTSQTARVLAIVYLPLAVIALADAVSDVQMIGLRRRIRETDFGKLADECLLRDALRDDGPPNLDPVLNEAEFLVDQLIASELVDEEAVKVINRQFQLLTRRQVLASADDARALNAKLVFEEMRERVKAGKTLSAAASAIDLNPDGSFKWSSYEEWKKNSWQVRVKRAYAEKMGRDANSKGGNKEGKAGQIRTIVGATRGKKK